jgi:hypothetical protein
MQVWIAALAVLCGCQILGEPTSSFATPTPTPSPTLPSRSPELNTVEGSTATFELKLSFSGAIRGDMTRAHSSRGLCDAGTARIDVFLDGAVEAKTVRVHLLVDRAPGPIRGIFAITPSGESALGSMAASYVIGADLVSGTVDSDLASGGVGTPAGHASGAWKCHL